MSEQEVEHKVEKEQRLRLERMAWGFASQGCTILIVLGLYFFELLPLAPVLVYLAVIFAIDVVFVALIKSGLNLRLADPSMTAAQIIAPLWPAIYIMYFVSDPQARTAFLLLATGGLLFGMLALRRRGMLLVGGTIVAAYLILLTFLQLTAAERINWRVEVVIVFAYMSVLVTVSYLGSFIASMRTRLREQNKALAELASRDQLTQLPNRRSLMEQLDRESARSERRSPDQDSLCVSMLDVDHFKQINDNWGHDAGDAVLRRISDALSEVLRQGDFVGRFGGEEFVIILPETGPEAAEKVTRRVREQVAGLVFPELPDDVRITVSQGLAVHRDGEDVTDTLKRADLALYEAKAAGRNRVIRSSG